MKLDDQQQQREAEESRRTTWRRLRRMGSPRWTRANVLAAALTVALGFAIATQIQQNQATGLQGLRQDELVRVLDDVNQRAARLDQQVRELEAQRDSLTSGADTAAQAAAQAQRRVDQLGVLAGTLPASGPGIRLTIADPAATMKSPLLLDVLQELRDAGAEVVQVGGVRVVASTYFSDVGGSVTADGEALPRPYVFLAIGDSKTLASAMQIPGGIVDTARRQNGSATVEELKTVSITATRTPKTPRYATPVPEPTVGAGQ
ncbi:MAG: DUF881 domain-containing protein [Dermatophilaceae bacterium]